MSDCIVMPRLFNRGDGVNGHFCIGRRSKDGGFYEFWCDRQGWCSAGMVYVGRDVAEAKLKEVIDMNFEGDKGGGMSELTQNDTFGKCECVTWGSEGILFLNHHPNCPQYRPEPEIRELLQRLLDGIESWASDEDGVHPDCWQAYVKACGVCGQWSRPKASA